MSQVATILHISDLHLVEDLSVEGGRFKSRSYLAKSHANDRLAGFFEKLSDLRAQGKTYDLVLGTGDLTTDGSPGAINKTLEFFSRRELRDSSDRLISYGLNLTPDRRLLVPGNHDRYAGRGWPWQEVNSLFEDTLGTIRPYPYLVGYRRPEYRDDENSPTLLFFVFDSTPPASFKNSILGRPARGFVSPFDCQDMFRLANDAVASRTVNDLTGAPMPFDPENCIRVAVLHHHPVVDEVKVKKFKKTTYMVNHETFVRFCFKTGINLVLFGHEHIQYGLEKSPPPGTPDTPFGPPSVVRFLCCPSAFEYSQDNNGFFLIDFDRDGIEVTLYEWDSFGFNTQVGPDLLPL